MCLSIYDKSSYQRLVALVYYIFATVKAGNPMGVTLDYKDNSGSNVESLANDAWTAMIIMDHFCI